MNQDRDRDKHYREDMEEPGHITLGGIDESEDPLRLQAHYWPQARDRGHVDLTQEEYTPTEAARMLGINHEVIMHAIYEGDLKANRAGKDVVCINRSDLADWLRRRGPGV